MQIQVNGEIRQLEDGLTVAGLTSLLSLDLRKVAIEKNREIVPRADYAGAQLSDGDQIEIVQFIGGG